MNGQPQPIQILIELTPGGQFNIRAPMDTQEQKNISYQMLAQAIGVVTNYKPQAIVAAPPGILNGIHLTR